MFTASVEFTADLHSMGQYIQQGVRCMFETVLWVKNPTEDVTVGYDDVNGDGLNFLAGKTMHYVNNRALQGTILAHTDGNVPNILVEIDKMDEYNLGEMIYFFELACGISGYTLGINPFDQPGVEAYKKNMFALLGKPGYEELYRSLAEKLGR